MCKDVSDRSDIFLDNTSDHCHHNMIFVLVVLRMELALVPSRQFVNDWEVMEDRLMRWLSPESLSSVGPESGAGMTRSIRFLSPQVLSLSK